MNLYSYISFVDLASMIKDRLTLTTGTVPSEINLLNVSTLFSVLEASELTQIKSGKIDWDAIGNLEPDLLINEFTKEAFENLEISNQENVYILLDSCFKERKAFQITFQNLSEFIYHHWSTFECSDMLESFDHLIVTDKYLILIHHEGNYWVYS